MILKRLAMAFGLAMTLTATNAVATYDGPWKLFDPNNVYISDLYRDNASSTQNYVVFKSSNGNNWIFLDSAWNTATPGSGPYQGFWVTYQPNPGFVCNGPPAVDDLGLNHNVWGYIRAYAAPDGVNVQFDTTRCDGPWAPWAQTLEN